MSYAYYPGCSLTGTASEYDLATRKVMELLGIKLQEIPDWTCCGASAAEAVHNLLSYALPARNLALVERDLAEKDVLVPCSACYLNLLKVQMETQNNGSLLEDINHILSEEGLKYGQKSKVRHILEILITDIGVQKIKDRVTNPLQGMTFAPYYGCQILRPYARFDDPERPSSMKPIIEALGANVLDWEMGAKCCGASLMTTKKEVALSDVRSILKAGSAADAILTVCPMCEMNLESFQKQALRTSNKEEFVAVLYLPQIMALALGVPREELLLGQNMMAKPFLDRYSQ